MTVQPMDDASPTKWHLAHVTWFFETFILAKHLPGYQAFDEPSTTASTPITRARARGSRARSAGVLTRPSAERVLAYRAHVDEALAQAASRGASAQASEIARLIEVGINHEQQHQELLLTDILALFAASPLAAGLSRRGSRRRARRRPKPLDWIDFAGGIRQVGHDGNGFAWDNEAPRHDALIHPFRLADRLVTNAANGSSSWPTAAIARPRSGSPTAGRRSTARAGRRRSTGRSATAHGSPCRCEGLQPVEPRAPRRPRQLLRGRRLRALGRQAPADRVRMGGRRARPARRRQHARHPRAAPAAAGRAGAMAARARCSATSGNGRRAPICPTRATGRPPARSANTTASSWCSQQVLRGGSCATPDGHTRATYRNFFYPHQRWQFMGLRLASEIA